MKNNLVVELEYNENIIMSLTSFLLEYDHFPVIYSMYSV